MGLVLGSIFVPLVLAVFFFLANGIYRQVGISLTAIGLVTGAVVLLLTYPLYYQITSDELIVRCGILMRRHIPIVLIDGVQPDNNPASAPAWSMDRLRVDYRKGAASAFIMISPADKFAFMDELARTATALELRGERLVRT